MIEHVAKGQRIAAAHMNNLIDSINYNDAFIDEYIANTPGGMPMLPKSFVLESVSKTTGDLSALSTTLSAIGCYNIRFEDGKSKEPITTEDKIWEDDLDEISSIWLVKDGQSISVVNNIEISGLEPTGAESSDIEMWKLYEVEVSSDANGFAIVNDYRDIAFYGGKGGGGGGGESVVPDMSSLNYVEKLDESEKSKIEGSGTPEDPLVLVEKNPDGTEKRTPLPTTGTGSIQNPGWAHVTNGIREYWVKGGVLRGGTTPLDDKWSRGGTISNPYWQKGGTIGNPYWKKDGGGNGDGNAGAQGGNGDGNAGAQGGNGDGNAGAQGGNGDGNASNDDEQQILQNWNYNTPLSSDRVDINSLSAINDYSFLTRPEPYGGILKYASLSGILSALSSESYGVFRFQGNTGTKTIVDASGTSSTVPCGTVTQCNVQIGRKMHHLNDETSCNDGLWCVYVQHSMGNLNVEFRLESSLPTNTLSDTYIPIFKIQDQAVVEDYRGMPVVPVWGDETN